MDKLRAKKSNISYETQYKLELTSLFFELGLIGTEAYPCIFACTVCLFLRTFI